MATGQVCPSCGRPTLKFFAKQGRLRCTDENCGDEFAVDPATGGPVLVPSVTQATPAQRSRLIDVDLERLPSVIAIPAAEYVAEGDPRLSLWHVCDTMELALRLLVAIGIADVLHVKNGTLPEALRRVLAQHIETPTLGRWLAMATAVAENVLDSAVVPEVQPWITRSLMPLLNGPAGVPPTIETSLVMLRNQLAHGGGVTHAVAARLLQLHAPRFEEVLRAGAWLGDLELVALRAGQAPGVLVGPAPGLRAFRPASEDVMREVARAAQVGGAVVLVRGSSVLPLWPLLFHGVPARLDPDAPAVRSPATQVYVRRDDVRLLLTPLGSEEVAQSVAPPAALEDFLRLFVTEPKHERGVTVPGYEEQLEKDAAALIGREQELAVLKAAIAQTKSGVLWVSGQAGIGKSFLMARLAVDLMQQPDGPLVLAYRFSAADRQRCSRASFLRFACERLCVECRDDDEQSNETEGEGSSLRDLEALLPRVGKRRQVVFVLDGMDELALVDPAFVKEMPLGKRNERVVWICSGRPEMGLPEAFRSIGAMEVFEDGLPAMSENSIRAMLIEGMDRARKRLLALDREVGGRITNGFVESVTTRAQGLPLYVRFVLGDLLAGKREVVENPDWLPQSLAAYYEKVLERLSVGILQQTLTPLACTLAIAREPLDVPALHALLAQRDVVVAGAAGLETVTQALAAIATMIRRAPTADGETGYTLYHHSLQEHMATSAQTRQAVETAEVAVAKAAAAWEEAARGGAARYLFRNGVAHLAEVGLAARATELLTDFDYLMSRLEALGGKQTLGLVDDIRRLETAGVHDERSREWFNFICTRAHQLTRGGQTALLQLSIAEADDSAVTLASETWVATGKRKEPWLRRVGRPKQRETNACLLTLEGHIAGVSAVALHPDRLRAVSASYDKTLKVWDLESGACLHTLKGHSDWVLAVAVHPNGRRAISGSRFGSFKIWDLEIGGCLQTFGGKNSHWVGAVHPDCLRAVSACDDGALEVLDLDAGECKRTLDRHSDAVMSVVLHADGRRAVSTSSDKTLKVWDLETGACLQTLTGHRDLVWAVALHPNGRCAVSTSRDGTFRVWNLETGACMHVVEGHSSNQGAVAVHPDCSRAVLTGKYGVLEVWNLELGVCLRSLGGENFGIHSILVHPDGRRAVTGSTRDGTLKVWDLEMGSFVQTAKHQTAVAAIGISPDGRRALSAGYDGKLLIWDAVEGMCLRSLDGDGGSVEAVAVLPGGRRGVVVGHLGTVGIGGEVNRTFVLRNLETGARLHTLETRSGAFGAVAAHIDGRWAVSGCLDGTLEIWDLVERAPVQVLSRHSHRVTAVGLHRDGRLIISGCLDGLLKVWDPESGACLRTIDGHSGAVLTVTLSSDGRRAASSGDQDATIKMWDLESGTCLRTLEGHSDAVQAVALHPDGRRAASAGKDKELRIWDVESGHCISCWHSDASINVVSISSKGLFVPGDSVGNVLFLQIEGM